MKYSMLNAGTNNNMYYVREYDTGNLVTDRLNGTTARGLVAHLNRGGGFDGWTPAFFLNRIKEIGE